VTDGFKHAEEAYRGSVDGGFRFQIGNAVFNATWGALHLAHAEQLGVWYQRAGKIGYSADGWPRYMQGLVGLERGEIDAAIDAGRFAGQLARDSGYQKMVWRTSVLQAQGLAESMCPEEAAAILPALSTRVDAQDAIYDTAARVRTCLAAGDAEAASSVAITVKPEICNSASPADVVAEAVTDAVWLRQFIDALPIRGEVAQSPRLAAARGRLALLEGRTADALQLLQESETGFRSAGLVLDCWHVGRALAEAEVRSGDGASAERRLKQVVADASSAGALLAARLAADTAVRLGLDAGPQPSPRLAASARSVVTGERMVSVLFADVRGYSELTGETPPADLADRIAAMQRWAKQEVERRSGIVDKFAGDAIMATFNVSGQSVDHAVQALRAALAIIDKAALAGLPVGAGVAVGPAVVGSLADSANLSVLGEVTNLASRLQARAAAGQVLLSEEVYRRARNWLDAQRVPAERGELELKGFTAPVVAYTVNSAVPEEASA
jgi:class 3 adenylate cyclase